MPKVHAELDEKKDSAKGKIQKRAKKISSKLYEILINHEKTKIPVLRCKAPNPTKEDRRLFDLIRSDNMIILTALKSGWKKDDIIIVSADKNIQFTAEDFGLGHYLMEDEYLLPPEQDEKDVEIQRLKHKLEQLKTRYSSPAVLFDSGDNEKFLNCPLLRNIDEELKCAMDEVIFNFPEKSKIIMAKQNNSLTELQALEGIYEHLSTIDHLSEEVGKLSTRLSKIEQTHNTTLTTMTAFTESMTRSFDEMKKAKAAGASISVYRKEDVTMTVRSEVKSAVSEVRSDFNRHINQIADTHKRPPLINIRINLSAKVLAIILAIEIIVGTIAYFWFVNTSMCLGNELYHSYQRLNYPNPGAGSHKAYQLMSAGERKQLRHLISASESKEHSYIAYRDTLQQLLNDKSIYINRIQYKNTERLIDYTDSTDIIKTAHFRKDGSVRITDDHRIVSLENVSHKGIQWIKVR